MEASYVDALPERSWHGMHFQWSYSPDAFRESEKGHFCANFLPLTQQVRACLDGTGRGVFEIPGLGNAPESPLFSNPYSWSGATLSLLLLRSINASIAFFESDSLPEQSAIDAEVERIHHYGGVLLYAARFCESAIKQMLFCTAIRESRYKKKALGGLLESPCPDCNEANKKTPHNVSLLGTLAHPYGLCGEFKACAMDHVAFLNKLRNDETAHSDVQRLNVRSVAASKQQLSQDIQRVLDGLYHMLCHFEKLEAAMLADLENKAQAVLDFRQGKFGQGYGKLVIYPSSPIHCSSCGVTLPESEDSSTKKAQEAG